MADFIESRKTGKVEFSTKKQNVKEWMWDNIASTLMIDDVVIFSVAAEYAEETREYLKKNNFTVEEK